MKRVFILVNLTICLTTMLSCRTYWDYEKNSFRDKDMAFDYKTSHNEMKYFSNLKSLADKEVFYATHFRIRLPKGIVYWCQYSLDKFYFEYPSNQIVYVYTSYKNIGGDSERWEARDVSLNELLSYLTPYWVGFRHRDYEHIEREGKSRKTVLYTNGKYKILIYNIKKSNFMYFVDLFKKIDIDS